MLGIGQLLVTLVLMMECQTKDHLVPQIPSVVKLGDVSTYNLWNHALRMQPEVRDGDEIQTLLTPDEMLILNMVPMDAPHALYSDDYASLRTRFLLGYMVQENVDPKDPRMEKPEGLTVKNLNGESITFKKTSEGKMTANGVGIEKTRTLAGGVNVYFLEDFLFDHQKATREAVQEYLSRPMPQHLGHFMDGESLDF